MSLPDRVSEALASGNPRLRLDGIRECLALEDPEARAPLEHLLTDDDLADLRAFAARAIGVCAGEDARGSLLAAARDDGALEVRLSCIESIGWTGDRGATAALADLLDDAPTDVVVAVLLALGEIGGSDESAASAVERRLADEEAEVRAAAALALAVLGNARQRASALDYALGDPDPLVRLRAAQARVRQSEDGAVDRYIEVYEKAPADVRARVIRALPTLEREHALPLLRRLATLEEADEGNARDVALLLADHGCSSGAPLLARLHYEGRGGFPVARALAELGVGVGDHELRRELERGHGPRRMQAVRALCLLGHEDALGAVAELLGSGAGADRRFAAFVLARAGSRDAIPELLRTLDFAYLRERRVAGELLATLIPMESRTRFDPSADRLTRRRAIEQLEASIA